MRETKFEFLSANRKTMIQGVLWEPLERPKAVIYIAHGITEHIGRYAEFAKYFTEKGYAVAGHDHLGHGKSVDEKNPLWMYFGPKGSWEFVEEDVKTGIEMMRQRFPEIPFCLMGFSLGSFVARCLLADHPEAAELAIIAGTGHMNAAEYMISKVICEIEERRFGDETDTPLLHKLSVDHYNEKFKPCRTGMDWICSNAEEVDRFVADPLCGDGFTVSSFRELIYGMKTCSAKENLEKMNKEMPVLLISGSDDPVGGFKKGVEKVRQMMGESRFQDVELKIFEGMRHDIFHEKENEKVLECIRQWMEHIN